MNLDELLDYLDELLDDGMSVPLSGGKHVVDVDKAHDVLDDVRAALPDEIRQAKNIVNDRGEIISGAKREAESIIKKAEDRARVMVSEQEIVKAAQQRATEIVSNAQSQSRALNDRVTAYCDNMLRVSEEQMLKVTGELKATRANFRQKAKLSGKN